MAILDDITLGPVIDYPDLGPMWLFRHKFALCVEGTRKVLKLPKKTPNLISVIIRDKPTKHSIKLLARWPAGNIFRWSAVNDDGSWVNTTEEGALTRAASAYLDKIAGDRTVLYAEIHY